MDMFLLFFWISIILLIFSTLFGTYYISKDLIMEDVQEELEEVVDEEYIAVDVTLIEVKTKKKNRNQ